MDFITIYVGSGLRFWLPYSLKVYTGCINYGLKIL